MINYYNYDKQVKDNHAESYGGAIAIGGTTNLYLDSCLF